ncbi:MAG: hypothetical protein ACR2NO_09745 [Chloroflexota bacterium]
MGPLGDLPQAVRLAALSGMRLLYFRAFVQNSPENEAEEFEPRGDWRAKLNPPWIDAIMAPLYDSASLLAAVKKLARRPPNDQSMTDLVWYQLLTEA